MSIIKYNNKTINKLEHNASEVKKMYYDGDIAYGVDGGSPEPPTPPSFDGKWLATYSDSHTESAQCDGDASSATTNGEISKTDLAAVEIGNCVRVIGAGTFSGCTSLTSVTIPDSVTSIGRYAFSNCTGLTSVAPKGSGASVEIPSGVTRIYDSAFYGCSSLTSVTIPNSVTSIEKGVFERCSGLTSVTIPDSVTIIGNYPFRFCSSLTSVTIPDSVTSIGSAAFRYCSSLTSVTVNADTPPTLGTYSFDDTNNCPIYVPAASVSAYQSAANWSTYASRIQAIP